MFKRQVKPGNFHKNLTSQKKDAANIKRADRTVLTSIKSVFSACVLTDWRPMFICTLALLCSLHCCSSLCWDWLLSWRHTLLGVFTGEVGLLVCTLSNFARSSSVGHFIVAVLCLSQHHNCADSAYIKWDEALYPLQIRQDAVYYNTSKQKWIMINMVSRRSGSWMKK